MCGIAGFTVAPGDLGTVDTEGMTWSLALDMMKRGSDATGVYTADPKRRFKVRKDRRKADVFLAGRAGIGMAAQTVQLHTRASTQGSPANAKNNHPIVYRNIIGVHNGIVSNDDELFEHFDWERYGEVDSEAIFAALHHLDLDEALTNIDASWAISWVDTQQDPRKLWLARGYSSPLCYGISESGTVVYASTYQAVEEAFKYGGFVEKPKITAAQHGFLACTDPDQGGLHILPEFDGSGKNAIGHRTSAWGNRSSGDWEGASAAFHAATAQPAPATTPKPTVSTASGAMVPFRRYPISGDPNNPKVGDRRRWVNLSGDNHVEVCTQVEATCSTWRQVFGNGEYGSYSCTESNAASAHKTEATVLPDPFAEAAPPLPLPGCENDDTSCSDDPIVLHDRDDGYLAQVGDIIAIPKHLFDGGQGDLTALVLEIGDDDTMWVEFRAARIDRLAYYDLWYRPAMRGA